MVGKDSAWRIEGTYLEACNCDPICPCRRIDEVAGGRSTFGECTGALSWQIATGHVGDVDLADLQVVLASRYHDDEPGSPWTYFLYLDERADPSQFEALEGIFTGRLGGSAEDHFPWAWKASDLLGVRPVAIEIDHTPGRGWFRAGGEVSVKVRAPYEGESTVTCVIPGHDRTGREVHAESIRVAADGLGFEVRDRCGYESSFAYSS
jgi:hypothetical protein